MKANELRLGNWVSLNGNSTQVDVIDYNQIIATELGLIELKFIKPIPLTEEWLSKFGFNTDKVTFGIHVDNIRFRLFQINASCSYNDNENEFTVTVYQYKYRIEICRIKYVHQLQNLYFALTNEELKIEL